MSKGINVLSLCDGMSCGSMVFEKLGIKVNSYYASEIKPIAIQATKTNFPNVIQIGDVNNVSYDGKVLHTDNGDFDVSFDIVMFGSPCQSFSRAMNATMRVGLDDNIRSGIFKECYRVLKEVNPKYFLMENVVMKGEDESYISSLMGVNPIRINSSVITGQMRDRLYWTNVPQIGSITPKDVTVNDILTDGYYPYEKSRCLMKNDSHGYYNGCGFTRVKRFYRWYYKAFSTLVFNSKEDFEKCRDAFHNLIRNGEKVSAKMFDDYEGHDFDNFRYLWKEERARLQTVPEKYVACLSEQDAADLIGDGWTVDVIAHLLSGLKKEF